MLDRHLFGRLALAAPVVLGLAAELGEDAGDAAGDGLEGLAREADVGGAQAADEAGDELQRDLGVAGEQRAHVVGRQRQQLALGQRLGAGRALVAVEHRQLAEDLARAERGEGDRPAVGVFAGDPEAALLDDVAGVGVVALVEDPGPGRKGARHGDVREALQLPLLQVGEERHALQQLDRALICLRHCVDYGNAALVGTEFRGRAESLRPRR